jgi:hypothetical protein
MLLWDAHAGLNALFGALLMVAAGRAAARALVTARRVRRRVPTPQPGQP